MTLPWLVSNPDHTVLLTPQVSWITPRRHRTPLHKSVQSSSRRKYVCSRTSMPLHVTDTCEPIVRCGEVSGAQRTNFGAKIFVRLELSVVRCSLIEVRCKPFTNYSKNWRVLGVVEIFHCFRWLTSKRPCDLEAVAKLGDSCVSLQRWLNMLVISEQPVPGLRRQKMFLWFLMSPRNVGVSLATNFVACQKVSWQNGQSWETVEGKGDMSRVTTAAPYFE